MGRNATNKVVVLLTDGLPNLYSSSSTSIDAYISSHSELTDFYNNGAYWCDAPLMQAASMNAENWSLYPVGIGLGCDYDFMDRMARLGNTANSQGRKCPGQRKSRRIRTTADRYFQKDHHQPQIAAGPIARE